MSLEDTDILELVDRYNWLVQKYAPLALELAPKLEEFGRYKQELQMLTTEFARRGYTPEDPESLTKLIEEAIKKRETEGATEG
jgi:hypothetical protein